MQAATLGLATEDAHRQQQVLQWRDGPQQVVGHDPHVAADTANRVQQCEGIQCPGGVVGDDQQAAGGGNLRQRGRIHLVLAVDEFQAGSDETESAQSCTALQESFDLVQPRPAPDAAQQRPRQLASAAVEPIREALLETLFKFLHGGSTHARRPDWPTACARQAAARWRFWGRTMTTGPSCRQGRRLRGRGPQRPPRCHAGGTLGLDAGPQSRPDGPCRAYTGLTTGNRYRFTMHRRRTPCIIRAHLSIRIKGYYA